MGKRLLRALSLVFGSILVASLVCKIYQDFANSFILSEKATYVIQTQLTMSKHYFLDFHDCLYLVIRYLKVLLLD